MPFAHLTRSLLRSLLRIEPGEGLRAGLMLLYSVAAVGGVVSLANLLATPAREGQTLVGPETVKYLEERFRLERLGRERLKNVAEAVEIHAVVGRIEAG